MVGIATNVNSMVVPQKAKQNYHMTQQFPFEYRPQRIENRDSDICMLIFVEALLTIAKGRNNPNTH